MSKHGSGRLFIRVICTDMYIDRQTGIRCARQQQFRLGRLPVFVEIRSGRQYVTGTEYVGYPPDAHVYPRMPARRCPKCGRALPGAPRDPDEGGGVEPHRSALARRRPETLRPCGGHLGPGLFLVAGCSKGGHHTHTPAMLLCLSRRAACLGRGSRLLAPGTMGRATAYGHAMPVTGRAVADSLDVSRDSGRILVRLMQDSLHLSDGLLAAGEGALDCEGHVRCPRVS